MGVPRWVGPVLAVVAGALAFTARLLPVLRGGGLSGIGNYDDGVYYAAGTALTHGLLPYRDFVFLHPPGILLATWPFGLLADVAGDPTGLAAARLTWMLLGALNCVLVGMILWPRGLLPAAFGAAVYAFSAAAVYTEWTTLLVAPAQTCVLLAVWALGRRPGSRVRSTAVTLGAGALLGLSATFKIWGVVAVVAVVVWLLLSRRGRQALLVLGGAVAAATVICLPFFANAPGRMWLMVVQAQFGRPSTGVGPATRLAGIVGLGLEEPRITSFTVPLVLALLLVAVLLVLAGWVPEARLPLALVVTLTAVLLIGPSWFLHYPGLVTGPLALGLGYGVAHLLDRVHGGSAGTARDPDGRRRQPRRWLGLLVAAALAVPVLAQAVRQRDLELGTAFPGAEFAARAAGTDGCVTADDLTVLAGMNVLTRNLDRDCPFVADFSGYWYVLSAGQSRPLPRERDPRWQAMYLDQLRTGTYALPWRYPRVGGLSAATRETVTSWPRVLRVGSFSLRDPHLPPHRPPR